MCFATCERRPKTWAFAAKDGQKLHSRAPKQSKKPGEVLKMCGDFCTRIQ